jgi:hypothetical protein|mmetsp:Transcript_7243/g.11815  ORF Transcript_7243/g.11815 Transcript_7243/m.11815 type:complete len:119 (+) Transcript_7243:857-1213(+)
MLLLSDADNNSGIRSFSPLQVTTEYIQSSTSIPHVFEKLGEPNTFKSALGARQVSLREFAQIEWNCANGAVGKFMVDLQVLRKAAHREMPKNVDTSINAGSSLKSGGHPEVMVADSLY